MALTPFPMRGTLCFSSLLHDVTDSYFTALMSRQNLFARGQRATEQILFIIGTSVCYVTQGVADFRSMDETVYHGSCKMYMMPTFKFKKVWMKP